MSLKTQTEALQHFVRKHLTLLVLLFVALVGLFLALVNTQVLTTFLGSIGTQSSTPSTGAGAKLKITTNASTIAIGQSVDVTVTMDYPTATCNAGACDPIYSAHVVLTYPTASFPTAPTVALNPATGQVFNIQPFDEAGCQVGGSCTPSFITSAGGVTTFTANVGTTTAGGIVNPASNVQVVKFTLTAGSTPASAAAINGSLTASRQGPSNVITADANFNSNDILDTPFTGATVAIVPTVTSVAPTTYTAGSSQALTVNGSGFSTTAANNTVQLTNGATTLNLGVASATSGVITTNNLNTLTFPTGGTYTVKVTVSGAQSTTSGSLAVTLLPSVTGVNPTSYTAGATTTATITGTNFSTTAASNTVNLTGPATINVPVVSATATQLTVALGNINFTIGGAYALKVTTNSLQSSTSTTLNVAVLPDAPTVSTANPERYSNTSTKATFTVTLDTAQWENSGVTQLAYKFYDSAATAPASYTTVNTTTPASTTLSLTGTALPSYSNGGPNGATVKNGLMNGHSYTLLVHAVNPVTGAGTGVDQTFTFTTKSANLAWDNGGSPAFTETVSTQDLTSLLQNWNQSTGSSAAGEFADVVKDTNNKVNSFDLAVLLQKWGSSI